MAGVQEASQSPPQDVPKSLTQTTIRTLQASGQPLLQEAVVGQAGSDIEALWVEVARIRDVVEKNDEELKYVVEKNDEELKSEINKVLLKIDELLGEARIASESATQKRIDLILQNVGSSIGTVTADIEAVKTTMQQQQQQHYNEEGRRKAWGKNIEHVIPASTQGSDMTGARKQLQDAIEASIQRIKE